MRLEPTGTGLAAELVVEPVPGSGVWFEPGAGGATVFAALGSETVQARRDLAAERAGAERIVATCPVLAATAAGPPPWVFPDPAGALELLEQLHAAEVPCLWPKGEPIKIVAHAETSKLNLTIKSAAEWFSASGGPSRSTKAAPWISSSCSSCSTRARTPGSWPWGTANSSP